MARSWGRRRRGAAHGDGDGAWQMGMVAALLGPGVGGKNVIISYIQKY